MGLSRTIALLEGKIPLETTGIYQEAYRTGMNYPIGHSMSMTEGLAEFNKRSYPGAIIGRASKLSRLMRPKKNFIEEAWKAGWQRAVDDRKKAFDAINNPFQRYGR